MPTDLPDFCADISVLIRRTETSVSLPDAEFDRVAVALAGFQFERNPVYKAWCDRLDRNPADAATWQAIPTLPTVAFKESAVSVLPETSRLSVFHSSGTSLDQPSRHFHSRDSLALYELSLTAAFRSAVKRRFFPSGEGLSPHLVFLTPPPGEAPKSSLVHMFETLRLGGFSDNAGRETATAVFAGHLDHEGVWNLMFPELRRTVDSLRDRPMMILGTAFQWVHWLDHFGPRRFFLPENSVILETGGYKGRSREVPREHLHQALATTFGVPRHRIVTEYGMSELSSQAYPDLEPAIHSVESGQWFRFPPWVRIRALSPENGRPVGPGESGLLEIFDLANVGSVMALQTEDLAVTDGQRFQLLGRAGRAEPRGCSRMSA